MIKIVLCSLIVAFGSQIIYSRPWRVNQIPNGNKFQCANCHINVGGGGARNPFGQTVEDNLTNGNVRWDLIFNIDSDGDGATNGEELQDPNGAWVTGQPNPGDMNLVTKTWDPSSFPTKNSVEDITAEANTVVFPTISNGTISLKFDSKHFGQSQLDIYDIQGNKVFSKYISTIIGTNNLKFDLKDYIATNGLYFVVVRDDYFLIKKKFIYSK